MLKTLWNMLGQHALCGAALLAVANLVQAQGSLPPIPQPPLIPAVVLDAPKVQPIATISAQETPAPAIELPAKSATTPAASSEDDLKARVERLEKQNLELMNALKGMKNQPAQTPVSTEAVQGSLSAQDVRTLINGYFAEKDAKQKAEAKAKQPEWYEVGSDPSGKAKWAFNRLTFESPQKDFKAHLGGRLQFDSYYIGASEAYIKAGAQGAYDDNAFFRRVRIEFDGQAYENFEWDFQVDLERNTVFSRNPKGDVIANGNYPGTRFDDVWIGMRNLPVIGNVRIGHVRAPQGLEVYTSSRNLTFMERSSAGDAFCQEYDPGVWVFNSALDDRVTWAATVHRIDLDSKMGEFGKGDVAVTARLAGLPIYQNEGRCLVHVGGSYQYHSNAFNTDPNINERTFSYSANPLWRASYFTPSLVSTGTIRTDHIAQFGLEALAIWGPFSVQAEYFGVHAANATFPAGAGGKNIGGRNFNSGYIYGSYFLTGENRKYDKRLGRVDRVIPYENFYFVRGEDGGWDRGIGAWEIAARYDWMDLNDGPIKGGIMTNYTLGLNWYLNPNIKFQGNYTLTDLSKVGNPVGAGAPGHTPLIHALGVRVQWEF